MIHKNKTANTWLYLIGEHRSIKLSFLRWNMESTDIVPFQQKTDMLERYAATKVSPPPASQPSNTNKSMKQICSPCQLPVEPENAEKKFQILIPIPKLLTPAIDWSASSNVLAYYKSGKFFIKRRLLPHERRMQPNGKSFIPNGKPFIPNYDQTRLQNEAWCRNVSTPRVSETIRQTRI